VLLHLPKSIVYETQTSAIRTRINELSKAIESLKDARRYARPEQESRIDSMSQGLNELKLETQRGAAGPRTTSFQGFSVAGAQLFKVRLTSPNETRVRP
jgi:hypothetical protein